MPPDSKNRNFDYRSLAMRKSLLAEDVKINQYICRQMLESWGCRVDVANNGLEVLELLSLNNYDCILMDIQMPEMDGMEAARQIRQLGDTTKASIPIIAVTANALRGDPEKYRQAGMTDFLPKPYEEEFLFKVISKNLPGHPFQGSLSASSPDTYSDPAVATEAATQKLYDLSMIHSLSGGDESFIRKMVDLFIETVPPNVQALHTGLAGEQWEQVSKMAHKLKSTVDSMGIQSLKAEIREVESSAKAKESLDRLPDLISRISQVIEQVIYQLRVEFP